MDISSVSGERCAVIWDTGGRQNRIGQLQMR